MSGIGYHRRLIEGLMAESVDIDGIAASMEFKPVTKLPIQYRYVPDGYPDDLPPLSYTQSRVEQRIVTVTADGKETENMAKVGDFIFSGPSGERYVLTDAKLRKNYQGIPGQTLVPEQSPRMVARYDGRDTVNFKAPWGEMMVLKPGDFLVKGDDGYYRIAAKEYKLTYNMP